MSLTRGRILAALTCSSSADAPCLFSQEQPQVIRKINTQWRRTQAFAADAAAAGAPGKTPPANPLLGGRTVEEHVLAVVGRVRAGDLEQALLVLPFSDALRLLSYLCAWLTRGSRVSDHSLTPQTICNFLCC